MTVVPISRPAVRRPGAMNAMTDAFMALAGGMHGGACQVTAHEGPPGAGEAPRTEEIDQTFFVLRGRVTVGIGDQVQTAGPWSVVRIPAGRLHWYRFDTEGEMLCIAAGQAAALALAV